LLDDQVLAQHDEVLASDRRHGLMQMV